MDEVANRNQLNTPRFNLPFGRILIRKALSKASVSFALLQKHGLCVLAAVAQEVERVVY